MKLFGALILLLLVLVLLFVLANVSVLSTPATISFMFFEMQAPPGLVVLGLLLALVALLLLYVAALRSRMYREAYRHRQELERQRKLAESAEASRLKELRDEMRMEFGRIRATIDESGNGLAAQLGEMEEKLDRVMPGPQAPEL